MRSIKCTKPSIKCTKPLIIASAVLAAVLVTVIVAVSVPYKDLNAKGGSSKGGGVASPSGTPSGGGGAGTTTTPVIDVVAPKPSDAPSNAPSPSPSSRPSLRPSSSHRPSQQQRPDDTPHPSARPSSPELGTETPTLRPSPSPTAKKPSFGGWVLCLFSCDEDEDKDEAGRSTAASSVYAPDPSDYARHFCRSSLRQADVDADGSLSATEYVSFINQFLRSDVFSFREYSELPGQLRGNFAALACSGCSVGDPDCCHGELSVYIGGGDGSLEDICRQTAAVMGDYAT